MKYLVYIYYAYYILAGGFRNYSSELVLQTESQNLLLNNLAFLFMQFGEYLIFFTSLLIIVYPFKKWLHFFFFLILFSLNFYFQNFINYEKYIIFIDFIPLFFFLTIQFQNRIVKIEKLNIIMIRIIAIGFLTALAGKLSNGWLNPSVPVIHSYIFLVSNVFMDANFFQSLFLNIDNLFIYKSIDYGVLLFQSLALFVFIKPYFFRYFAVFAVLFHLGIMFLLNISFFFPYILVYAALLIPKQYMQNAKVKISYSKVIVVFLTLIAFVYNQFDVLFISRILPHIAYVNLSNLFTIISVVIFFFYAFRKPKISSPNKMTLLRK